MNPNFKQGSEITCIGTCGRTLPANEENFPKQKPYKDGSVRYKTRCWECFREKQREYNADHAETLRRSEELAERRRKAKAESRRRRWRDPDGREKIRESRRRKDRRKRRNQRTLKTIREDRRIEYRIAVEKQGTPIEEVGRVPSLLRNSVADRRDAFPRLPAGPLARAIDECDARRQNEFFAGFTVNWQRSRTSTTYTSEIDSLGIAEKTDSAERMVYGWRNGERLEANFDTVDAVLTRGRWLWWEVYNPETVRKHALMVTVRRRIEKRSRPQAHHPVAAEVTVDGQRVWRVRHSMYATTARRFLGDLGTDWEKLWEVEHAFTCEGVDHCWACWHRQQEENVRERERRQGEQLELAEAA